MSRRTGKIRNLQGYLRATSTIIWVASSPFIEPDHPSSSALLVEREVFIFLPPNPGVRTSDSRGREGTEPDSQQILRFYQACRKR